MAADARADQRQVDGDLLLKDRAIVFAALNGAEHPGRSSIEAPLNIDAEAGISRIKLGYLPESFGHGANEVNRAALAAARRLGIEVQEVSRLSLRRADQHLRRGGSLRGADPRRRRRDAHMAGQRRLAARPGFSRLSTMFSWIGSATG